MILAGARDRPLVTFGGSKGRQRLIFRCACLDAIKAEDLSVAMGACV
jgi:hypothetical protein